MSNLVGFPDRIRGPTDANRRGSRGKTVKVGRRGCSPQKSRHNIVTDVSLEAGRKLVHYEILERIGAGGMGEVFRARDTKLDRNVAIKVLPARLAIDEERLARFERQAKRLASLNRPNVATLHALESFEDERFPVIEVVLGVTLSEMMQFRAQAGSRPSREVSCVLLPREASRP